MTDTPVQTRFEVAPGADLAANPVTWDWQDHSDRLAKKHPVVVPAGKQDQQADMTAASTRLLLRNGDGHWTPRNPASPLYPYVDVGMPARIVTIAGTPHLTLDGTSTSRASTPDTGALDITGDLSGVIECVPHRMPSSVEAMNVSGKWVSAGNFSWRTDITHFGLFRFQWSVDGTAILEALSTAPIPRPDTMSALGWHIDVANGANRVITFYWAFTKAEILASPSAHILGQAVTQSGNTSIFNSNSAVEIGDLSGSSFPGFFGMVKSFQLRSGDLSTGTIATNIDFSTATEGATSVVDTTGKTYTLTGAAIDRRHIRISGETNTVTARYPENGVTKANRADVPISGPLRRFGQGKKPLKSALTRKVTSVRTMPSVTAYWPLEDERDATQVYSPIPGTPAGSMTMDRASIDTLPASKPLPSASGGAGFGWSCTVGNIGATDNWQVSGLFRMETFATGNPGIVLQDISTAGSSSNAIKWALFASSTDGIRVVCYASDGSQTLNSAFAYDARFAGVWNIVALRITQDGADIDWDVDFIPLQGSGAGLSFGTSGTVAGATAGRVTRLANLQTAPSDGFAVGHFSVTTDQPTNWLAPADSAYVNETAGARFRRLCDEENIPVTLIGDHADSAPMGPQRPLPLVDLLKECADTDLGMMGEQRYSLGLTYRTRASLYNQDHRLTIPTGGLKNPFEASADDAAIRNDVEVSRLLGSAHHVVDQAHIDSHGLYDDAVTINAATDGQLPDQTGWRLHQGTSPELRYPSLTAGLRGKPAAYADQWLFLGLGDRFQATDPPAGHRPDPIDQIADGWSEVLDSFDWDAEIVSSPASTWDVAVRDDADSARRDADGTVTFADITATEVNIAVDGTTGVQWTLAAGDYPFDLDIGGERVTATSATLFGLHVFVVTRSVNGVIKAHAAGTPVRLWRQALRAL